MRQTSSKLPSGTPGPKTNTQIALRFLWILAIGAITVGSLLPNNSAPMRALDSFNLSDTFQHFCAYAFLAFLPALHEQRRFTLFAALGAILLGMSLEFAQLFADGRSWELSDMGANTSGVCLGLLMGVPMRSIPIVRSLLPRATK